MGFRLRWVGRPGLPARGWGTLGAAGPRVGCSRGRVGDSCSRSIPAPARASQPSPWRAAPSNPHHFWAAPPAALSANTAFVCAGTPGQGVCVGRLASCSPPPAAGPPRVRSSRDTESGGNSSSPPSTRGAWTWSGLAGAWDLDCGASARTALSVPQFPHLKRNTQGLRGDPRAPEISLLSSCPLRLLSPLLRPAGPVRSGTGLEARASAVEVNTARLNWRRSQKGLGTRMHTLPSGPHPSSLCFQEIPLPLSSEETRRLSQSLQSGKLRPREAGRGLPSPRGWGRRTGCAGQLEDAPSPNSADPAGQGTAGRGLPGLNETRVWRRAAEGPRRHSRHAASMPGTRMRPQPLAARAPSEPSRKGGSDNQKRKYVCI